MIQVQKVVRFATDSFSEEEKIALLKAIQQVCLADEKYDIIESIGFDNLRDVLLFHLSQDQLHQRLADCDPVSVVRDRHKQEQVLECMIEAAIMDSHVDERESALISRTARAWGFSREELQQIGRRGTLQMIEMGLGGNLEDFVNQVADHFPRSG